MEEKFVKKGRDRKRRRTKQLIWRSQKYCVDSFDTNLVVIELLDRHLPSLGEGQVPQEDVGAEGQGVHVLSANGVNFALFHLH